MDQTSTYSPLVMQETSDGLRLYDIRDEMLASREIEITGAIDAGSVSTAIRCLASSERRPAIAYHPLHQQPRRRSSIRPCVV